MDVVVEVWTFKDGLLSRVAHDLKLQADAVVQPDWTATIRADSLRVVCAMKAGRPDHATLSDRDKRSIQGSLRQDVLHASRHPEIRFTPTQVDPARVCGLLSLHGVERPIELVFQGGKAVVQIDQRDFGIRPFSAMMGTLKVRPVVQVHIRIR